VLKAIIFDFNGILVDDEPIHLELFRKVLAEEGFSLTDEEYYAKYLGMDDRGCFRAVFKDNGRDLDDGKLAELIRRKAVYYKETIAQRTVIFPGVKRLVPELAARFPLAVASGALRHEIELILDGIGLKECFQSIVSAEDVHDGKPHPEIFIKALRELNKDRSESIRASECLVIEDSKEGIMAAHRAGIKCLAVTNSHPAAELKADRVVGSLEEVDAPFLEALFK
jgi:HAD superfamily hydrolase (TIGR01509 family)